MVAFAAGATAVEGTQFDVRAGAGVVRAAVATAVLCGVGLTCAAPPPQAAATTTMASTKVPYQRVRLLMKFTCVSVPDLRDLYYAAGILDGEGCISINKYSPPKPSLSPRYTPLVFVGNTQRPLVEWFLRRFGGTIQTRPGNARHRDCFIWVLPGPRSRAFVGMLRPYLMLKGAQADVLLDYYAHLVSFKGGSNKRQPRIQPEELARREALYRQIKALNKTGPRDDIEFTRR